jgi:phage gp29-like protein
MMILDHRGNPIKTSVLTKELAAPSMSGVRTIWDESVAGGLTPQKLARVLLAAAEGDPFEYLTLAEEMEEKDLHYRCELSKRKLAVASLPITVEAATDDKKDKHLAEEVRALAKNPGFRSLLKDLLDGLGKGYSVCEIIWNRGVKWKPGRYEWRDPRFFTFDRDTRRTVRLLDAEDPTNGIELAPYKFVTHLPHLKTGIPIRGGIARVAAWAWMFKNYTVKDWLAFADVFGMPLRVGKYKPGTLDKDIDILKMAVANLGTDAAAVMPDSMLIDFIETKTTGSLDLFSKMADWFDAQVSRGILGQTGTTQGTPGKLGNDDALSEVREDIRDDDATQLSETINRDLVIPFIDLNFGPQENYPELVIKAIKREDLTILTTALEKLVPLGLKVEQSVVRDKYGLPDPAEGAECLAPPVSTPPPGPEPSTPEPPPEIPPPLDQAKNSTEGGNVDHVEASLYRWVKNQSAPASSLIDAAAQLLDRVDTLEGFRERLIDLYAATDPEQLAEVMARLDLLANMAGRIEAKEEQQQQLPVVNVSMPEIVINNEMPPAAAQTRKNVTFIRDAEGNLTGAQVIEEEAQ